MTDTKHKFGPQNKDEERVFAVEGFRVDVRHELQKLLNAKQLTFRALADLIGMSEEFVVKIMTIDDHLTLEWLGEIAFALDMECAISFKPRHTFENTTLAVAGTGTDSNDMPYVTVKEIETGKTHKLYSLNGRTK